MLLDGMKPASTKAELAHVVAYMPTQQQLEVACLFSASTHAPAAAPRQQSFEGKRRRQVT